MIGNFVGSVRSIVGNVFCCILPVRILIKKYGRKTVNETPEKLEYYRKCYLLIVLCNSYENNRSNRTISPSYRTPTLSKSRRWIVLQHSGDYFVLKEFSFWFLVGKSSIVTRTSSVD